MSKAQSKAYVRVSFAGKFKIGIGPINLTLQSFKNNATVYCTSKGKVTASWR